MEPKDIRELYTDFTSEWKDTRDEAKTDVRYVIGDPWTPSDRRMREDAGRPCISLDEINQYLNQYNNSLRQNKRGIQVIPKGMGANDQDATLRENIIRGIEYESNAQQAYITAAENAASRSYGFALIRTEFKDEESFDQRIVIQRVGNPDLILISPYYEKADASDIQEGFVLKRMRKDEFTRNFPNAEKTSFTNEDVTLAPEWISDKFIQVAEFWKVSYKPRKLYLLQGPAGLTIMSKDALDKLGQKPAKSEIKDERTIDSPRVTQYITNGLEILEEHDWAGSRIPIISCFGKEIWIDEGGGPKRKLLSMVRLARDPQMMYAYLCSQEAEEAGLSPKVPFIGYVGQFEKSREVWEVINKQPYAFVEADVVLDGSQGALPLPTRPAYTPNFQQYEIAKDSVRRAIQAAMGISPLPTAAQRNNEKSGIALEKIATQESIGSFHFSDNYDRFLQNMGWQINELIKPVMDTQREVMSISPDEQYQVLNVVGDTSHPMDEQGQYDMDGLTPAEHLHTGRGNYDVTISTGPSYQSQREEQSEFVDTLISNMQNLPMPNTPQAKVFALGIRMRNDLGPIGKQIADVFDPPDPSNLPPQAQAVVQNLQSQIQMLTQQNQALLMDRAGKVLEQQTKLQIEDKKIQAKGAADAAQHQSDLSLAQLANDVKVLLAEIATKAQSESERNQMYYEFWKENHNAAHEHGMQVADQMHEQNLAQQAAATAAQSQSADQAHEVGMAGVNAATAAQSQAADQAHQQQMASQQLQQP